MKRRVFVAQPPTVVIDYRDDEIFISAIEHEVKLASRYFAIVDFITANLEAEEDKEDLNLFQTLGRKHWAGAKSLMRRRRELLDAFGERPPEMTPFRQPEYPSPEPEEQQNTINHGDKRNK